MPPHYPPLAGNQSITMASPVNSIRMVLNGGYPPGTERTRGRYGMPPFAHILNDDEVAAVVTYIRVAWDNSGTPVTPRAGQRAAHAPARVRTAMIELVRRRNATEPRTARSTRSSGRGPAGAFAVAGHRHRDRRRDLLRLLLPRLPAARGRPVSAADPRRRPRHRTRSRSRAERRWADVVVAIIALLVAMMVFTGLHWAAMPPSRVETIDPQHAAPAAASSSRATSARRCDADGTVDGARSSPSSIRSSRSASSCRPACR